MLPVGRACYLRVCLAERCLRPRVDRIGLYGGSVKIPVAAQVLDEGAAIIGQTPFSRRRDWNLLRIRCVPTVSKLAVGRIVFARLRPRAQREVTGAGISPRRGGVPLTTGTERPRWEGADEARGGRTPGLPLNEATSSGRHRRTRQGATRLSTTALPETQPATIVAARAIRWSFAQGGPSLARGPCSTSSARSARMLTAWPSTSLAS